MNNGLDRFHRMHNICIIIGLKVNKYKCPFKNTDKLLQKFLSVEKFNKYHDMFDLRKQKETKRFFKDLTIDFEDQLLSFFL